MLTAPNDSGCPESSDTHLLPSREPQLQIWSILLHVGPPHAMPHHRGCVHPKTHPPQDTGTRGSHLILLLEAVAFGRLHLVDVLEEVSHAHGGMQLPGVVRGPFAATLATRGAPEEAAGLVDHAAALVTCKWRGRNMAIRGATPLGPQQSSLKPVGKVLGGSCAYFPSIGGLRAARATCTDIHSRPHLEELHCQHLQPSLRVNSPRCGTPSPYC